MTQEPTTAELKLEIERLQNELREREQARRDVEGFPPMVDITGFVDKNPLAAAAIALALGVTVGYLLKNTRVLDMVADKLGETIEKGAFDEQTVQSLLSRFLK
ncbi:MAG: hypothetical protein HUU10_00515 [Bacteroidetes bacterium]|nr:hypothetical protein [Bacteroidota bacterium]